MLPEMREAKPPILHFENTSIKDAEESEKQNRIVYKDVVLVRVRAAGDNKTEVPYLLDSWLTQLKEKLHHKFITQEHYDFCLRCYKRWKENEALPVNGTPVKGWPMLTSAEQNTVIAAYVTTVEELAELTEEGIAAIGMGARAMKKKAQAYLDSQDGAAVAMQLDNLRSDNESKDAQIGSLEEKLKELEAKINEPKKRGRPKAA